MWGRNRRRRRGRKKDKWYDGCYCDGFDLCDIPCCDLNLLSTSMLLVSRLGGRRDGRRGGPGERAALAAIRGYRRVSPHLPTRCRHVPTCSAYGLAAVQRYGTGAGLRLTVARLRRCRPGVAYGTHDPVPGQS